MQQLPNGRTLVDKWEITSPPGAEPVTTAEAKKHANVEHADDDSYIDLLISSARQRVEDYTGRILIDTTFTLYLDTFPPRIVLPFVPLDSVTSVKYFDSTGTLTTLTVVDDFQVDDKAEPAVIRPAQNDVFPDTEIDKANAVEIEFIAGYGTAGSDVPEILKTALKFIVARWYEIRLSLVRSNMDELPHGVTSILASHTVRRW